MSNTKNKLFQACKLLAITLVVFSTPVFAFNSYTDNDKYSAAFSAPFNSNYLIEKCFDGSATSYCASVVGGKMSITFNKPSKVTNLNLVLALTSLVYDYLEVDGMRYEYNPSNIYNFANASTITVFAKLDSFIYLREITFDFEYVDGVDGVSNNDITQGINWSLFAYSFTVVTFFAMLGRGIKSIIDLIKYG